MLGRALVAVTLLYYAIRKALYGPVGDAGQPSTLLAVLTMPWVWWSLIVIEVAAALALLARVRHVWAVVIGALALSVVLHGLDVLSRGPTAHGCGCFGDAAARSSAEDLVRAGLLLAMAWIAAFPPSRLVLRRVSLTCCALLGLTSAVLPLALPGTKHQSGVPWDAIPATSGERDSSGTHLAPPLAGSRIAASPAPSAPATPSSSEEQIRVSVLDPEGRPAHGAMVHSLTPSSPEAQGDVAEPAAGVPVEDDGVIRLALSPSPDELWIAASHPSYATSTVVWHRGDSTEVVVRLAAGSELVVRAIDPAGSPIRGLTLLCAPVGSALGTSDSWTRTLGAPTLAVRRLGTTDEAGVTTFKGLDPAGYYRVEPAPGSGYVRAQGGGPRVFRSGSTERTLVLVPCLIVWLRGVDAQTRDAIQTMQWAPVYGDKRLRSVEVVRDSWRVAGLAAPPQRGDLWYLVGWPADPGGSVPDLGVTRAGAPGYKPVEARPIARRLAEVLAEGPTLVPLEAVGVAGFGSIRVRFGMATPPDLAMFVLRGDGDPARGRETTLRLERKDLDSEGNWDLGQFPGGDYELQALGGSAAERVTVVPGRRTDVTYPTGGVREVRLGLEVDGVAFDGIAGISFAFPKAHMMYEDPAAEFRGGLSRLYWVASEADVIAAVGLPDGRTTTRVLSAPSGGQSGVSRFDFTIPDSARDALRPPK